MSLFLLWVFYITINPKTLHSSSMNVFIFDYMTEVHSKMSQEDWSRVTHWKRLHLGHVSVNITNREKNRSIYLVSILRILVAAFLRWRGQLQFLLVLLNFFSVIHGKIHWTYLFGTHFWCFQLDSYLFWSGSHILPKFL